MTKASLERIIKRMPKRTARVDFDGDYDGFYAEIWTNPPMSVVEGFNAEGWEATARGIAVLTIDWNLTDTEGNPIALPTEGADLTADIPFDLLLQIVAKYPEKLREVTALPNDSNGQSTTS